jgi:arylsulfatase A-like enzyme
MHFTPVILGGLVTLAGLSAQHKPNVLILLADDLGVDYIACYKEGSNPAKTPHIDGLAARGVLFRNAWANPLCSPTRSCLMTGRYGFRTGVGHLVGGGRGRGRRGGGDTGAPLGKELTLPKFLDAAKSSYAHALVGKWHLGGGDRGPNDAGWSHFAGLLRGALGRSSYFNWSRTVNGETAQSTKYATTQHVDDALEFIRASEKKQKPWFCMVTFIAPHSPFHQPPDDLHTGDVNAMEGRDTVARYRAMVEALDMEVGRLLKQLGPGLARTNVIFMGDNGTPRGVVRPPFRDGDAKGTIYEGGVNVPLIVAGPVVKGDPRESAALVGAVDMYSSVAELCGVDVAKDYPEDRKLDSRSFVPHLKSADHAPVRTTVFTEIFRGDYNRAGYAAIRDERFKLIRVFRGDAKPRDRMFDLKEDPFEVRNLLRRTPPDEITARHAKLAAELDRLRGSN